ncbi:PDZ domain-containing protein [Ascidiimonas aurantiaca]|uniref:PDZ domain-containing protein n=1 Tax=Ascidiimonas aurantiaca TaxID=1685432 RepID=UPI0030EB668C
MIRFVSLILLFIINSIYGQSAGETLQIINSANLSDVDFYKEIPFEDRFGYFIIPVTIGNDTYEYIFDTGGYNTITSWAMEKNGIATIYEVEVGSVNSVKSKTGLTKIPELTIAGLNFREVGALNFDFHEAPRIKCYTNGGLIGKGIIKNAIWQIDYQTKNIIVTDRLDKLTHIDGSFRIKVKLDKTFNPFITLKINGKKESFLLDLGYGGFISLTEKTGQKYANDKVVTIVGEGSIGANGVIQEESSVILLDNLEIGKQTILAQEAYYTPSNNYNLIGSELAKHFIITLNFQNKEMYLKPLTNPYSKQGRTTFGFKLNRNDHGVYVSQIQKNSVAEKAGMELEDKVRSINGILLETLEYCDFYFKTLKVLKGNTPIEIEVLQNGTWKTLKIEKGTIINP